MQRKHPEQAFIPAFCQPTAIFLVVLFCELIAFIVTLLRSPLPNIDVVMLGQVSLYIVWVGLLSASCLCMLRQGLRRWPLNLQVLTCYLTILAITAITSYCVVWAFSKPFWWLVNNLLLAAVIVGVALRYFVLHYQFRVKQQAELKQRIEALQARIRPHFLFNALNAIATMILIEPDKAESMTLDLAEITRESMKQPTLSPLAKELQLCRQYLEIESQRFGDRLHVNWTVAEEALGIQVPNLLIQPLLENAVYHGIQRRRAGGEVDVTIEVTKGQLLVKVANPLPDDDAVEVKGQQIALENIRHRLSALFGLQAKCELTQTAHQFIASICLPVQNNKESS